jgi:hypothetical protein
MERNHDSSFVANLSGSWEQLTRISHTLTGIATLRFQLSAFSLNRFFVGEKVAKPDEGAFPVAARFV